MDLSYVRWRKSSHSGVQGNCVEVAVAIGLIFTRDSKAPTGPVISCSHTEWTAFLGAAKNGNLDFL